MDEKYYKVQEIADIFKVTTRTVQQWIKSGKLNATKIGRVTRSTEKDIEEMKNANQTKFKN